MKKYFVIYSLFFLTNNVSAQKPILLDYIHYYVNDSSGRETAKDYFKTFFKGHETAQQEINPLAFIDLITLRPDESTINISSFGRFAGLKSDYDKHWSKEITSPSVKIPPTYGVRWLALNTKNIRKTVRKLLKAGYRFAEENFILPTEPDVNAVAMYGFDDSIIVIVERPKMKNPKTEFGIDHLQLLVNNLEDNVKFYQTVLAAEIIDKKERSTVLKIGNHRFVLSEPEALGLVRRQVVERDSKENTANTIRLGFLYDEIEPAFYGAKANNYRVIMEPTPLLYFDKPTPYTFCIVMSPDNLQIELEQEEGRTRARKIYKGEKNKTLSEKDRK
jgi:catechol 2,3-dioxygenase-like lactoylglutathione lyase family enzyme